MQEDIDDEHDKDDGLEKCANNIMDAGIEEVLRAHYIHEFHAWRQFLLYLESRFIDAFDDFVGIGARRLSNHAIGSCVSVSAVLDGVVLYAQLHISHIFEAKHTAIRKRLNDHILVVTLLFITTSVLQDILERVLRIRSKRACRRFDVLLREYIIYIRRHEAIRSHLERVEPDAHTVACSPDVYLAHTRHSRETRLDVNLHVVRQEVRIVSIRWAVKREALDVARLTFTNRHTASRYIRRQLSLRRSHTVLHVHHRHIGIRALLEENADAARTGVSGRRGHIHHVLHAIQALFKRNDDALLHRFGIGTSIVGSHAYRWWSNLWELLDRQMQEAYQS